MLESIIQFYILIFSPTGNTTQQNLLHMQSVVHIQACAKNSEHFKGMP